MIRGSITILSIAFFFILFCPRASLSQGEHIAILDIDINTYQLARGMKSLDLPPHIRTQFFTLENLKTDKEAVAFVAHAKVLFVNVMMTELAEYMVENDLLKGRIVYALAQGRNTEDLIRAGFLFDETIQRYHHNMTPDNVVNMVRLAASRHVDPSVTFKEPVVPPENVIYHPDAAAPFETVTAYQTWYEKRAGNESTRPRVGLLCYGSTLKAGQVEAMDTLIRKLEQEGFHVIACFGRVGTLIRDFLTTPDKRSAVDLVLAFSLKFTSGMDETIREALIRLDVPVFNVIRPYAETTDVWRKSEVGLQPMETVWAVTIPEISGNIEPTVLTGKKEIRDPDTGKRLTMYETVPETLDHLIPRLKKWVALRRITNKDKRVAIIYYNHSQGKQNIGAAYLNVFRSLRVILKRMKEEGYTIRDDEELTEDAIKDLVLTSGRNVGSWAPGELTALMESENVERVSISEYVKWFKALPQDFQDKVIAQWGPPEDCAIMTLDHHFIFPMVKLGNVVLLPEPARGWSDDPLKLYHDQTLFPHHQYIAAYLWLARHFGADAMVHLGTHATYEWLPGKQVGLSPSDPPEIMTGDIPNIYPYIVDDVGEGIQAKRRGRGVILDHLTPPMKEADLYAEYNRIHDLFHNLTLAQSQGSDTVKVYKEEIWTLVKATGLHKDLGLTEMNDQAMEAIHLYLHEIDDNPLPYGLHTYGKPYDDDAAADTHQLILAQNPNADKGEVAKALSHSPKRELDNFIHALEGGYIPAGEGNDPLRNLAAIPTGKNFYGFSPAKIPSRTAWKIGKQSAIQMIEEKTKKEGGYPEKVGVVLWATETTRNEGIHESTILYLMGVEPVWDQAGRVMGSRVIPGKTLGRPRIDVLINPSGLYRDMFPDKLVFLDEAVQKAMAQTDIENFLHTHYQAIKSTLVASGMDPDQADTQSRFRIFTEKTGTYGNGVAEMTSASGLWEDERSVADVYMNRTHFAVGQGQWGVPVKQAFTENLRDVDIAVHSRSSNVIGVIDTDDFFMYLGGMSMAVRQVKGQAPDTLVTLNRHKNEITVEDVTKTIGREMRTRYLNPQWIEGMKKDNYAGARQMQDFAENLWGWQVTVPHAVDEDKWQQVFDVYVTDKYDLDLKTFFNKESPWAYQSLTARMLETVRKGYWQPDESVTRKLAAEYAMNVVEKGVACCDHTCNNPLLNQMVMTIISIPGVVLPETITQFKLAIETMAQKSLEDQAEDRNELVTRLNAPAMEKDTQPSKAPAGGEQRQTAQPVEGFKMEEINTQDETTDLSSSGIQWFAALIVFGLLGVFFWGAMRSPQR